MKLILASLIVFSLIILFLFALFPTDISVSRVIQISSPRDSVLSRIADLRKWKSWNEMLLNPPAMDLTNSQSDKTDSSFISRGGLSITLLEPVNDTVRTQWKQGVRNFSGSYFLSETNGRTIVYWTLHFHLKWYPWEKLAGMNYDKRLGPLMENSLTRLRNELESGSH